MSDAEDMLAFHLDAHKIPYLREFRFHESRKWRADFHLDPNILVEVEGGVWSGGKHGRGSGIVKDIEKHNAATVLGYRVLRYTPDMVEKGLAIEQIQRILSPVEVP